VQLPSAKTLTEVAAVNVAVKKLVDASERQTLPVRGDARFADGSVDASLPATNVAASQAFTHEKSVFATG
jgi:hypothetical protein